MSIKKRKNKHDRDINLEKKSLKDLIDLLTKLVKETKHSYTEKDLVIFRHINSIDLTAKKAEDNLHYVKDGKEKVQDLISFIKRFDR